MTDQPLLQVRDVEAGYDQPVVGPVSFEVNRGEVFGLVGPNGSGKSTLLKAIADKARIFDGKVERRTEVKVAWMDQQPVRLPEMPFNGWEYLHYAEADGSEPPEHLAEWLDQRVDALSGGQFQLLSCWTVLGSRADLVMLDEPTNNLDEESEETLVEILAGEHDHRGVLLVSHDPAFLEQVCDRMLDVRK